MRIIQSDTPRPLDLLAAGPNGLVAAACGTFGVRGGVEVWDAATGAKRFTHTAGAEPTVGLALMPDGLFLVVAEPSRLLVLDGLRTAEGPRLGVHASGVQFSADGTRALVAGDGLECRGIMTDPAHERERSDSPHEFLWLWRDVAGRFSAPAISRDCHRVAAEVRLDDAAGRLVRRLSVRDGGSGRQVAAVPLDPASPVRQLAFTADGTRLLARTDSRKVQLFDANTGAAAGELVHRGRPFVTALAVHPRGPVACARTSGTVTLWDAETREVLRTLDWKAGKLVSVAFGPDGSLAAAGTEAGQIVVWDADL
jgi:WD40 repeat protein